MRYGVLNRPPHFDVHQSGTVGNIGTQGCMFDNLIRRDPRDSGKTIVPDLAHSWEIAKDSKTYTFHLRQGVQFHDGTEFTSALNRGVRGMLTPDGGLAMRSKVALMSADVNSVPSWHCTPWRKWNV